MQFRYFFLVPQRIDALKSQIQKRRIEHAMKGLTGDIKSEDFAIVEPTEDHIIAQIEIEKVQRILWKFWIIWCVLVS